MASDLTRIAGNIGAMNSLWSLSNINKQLSVHQSRLASGKRINTAADDPAGLTIATKMRAQSEGLGVALGNISDAKNLLAVAESGIGRINDILIEMRNKAQAGASDTMGSAERAALVQQMSAYAAQVDDIVTQTKWNGEKLIDGTYDTAKALTFQTGADQGDTTSLSGLKKLSATAADGLALAQVSGAATVSEGQDIAGLISSPVVGVGDNANIENLATGTYTVRVSGAAAGSAKIELLDSNGNAMLISNTPATGLGDATKALTAQDLEGAAVAVDFGNGLKVTIADLTGQTNFDLSATVNYTAGNQTVLQFNHDGLDRRLNADGTTSTSSDGGTTWAAGTASEDFAAYMDYINNKLTTVTEQLSKVGSLTGRLTFKEDQVSAAKINVEGAYNRIMNADMAEEQVNASKYQILQQTATAMLAQANSAPQFILSLFR